MLYVTQVVLRPYPIWGPASTANPVAKQKKQPTANPVPEYVDAALAFDVVNTGTSDIPAGWNFTLTNKNYTAIELVRNLPTRVVTAQNLRSSVNSGNAPCLLCLTVHA